MPRLDELFVGQEFHELRSAIAFVGNDFTSGLFRLGCVSGHGRRSILQSDVGSVDSNILEIDLLNLLLLCCHDSLESSEARLVSLLSYGDNGRCRSLQAVHALFASAFAGDRAIFDGE